MALRLWPSAFSTKEEALKYINDELLRDGTPIPGRVRFLPEHLIENFRQLFNVTPANPSELIHWVLNGYTDYPKKCICGKPITKFISHNQGYVAKYCSYSCSNSATFAQKIDTKDPENKQKIKLAREKTWFASGRFNFEGFTFLTDSTTWKGTTQQKFEWKCHRCNLEFKQQANNGIVKPQCPSCDLTIDGKAASTGHREIHAFIKEHYDGPIITNDRSTIWPKELDIYLPQLNLAIEYNGLYWHADTGSKSMKYYHIEKTDDAALLGIQVIHIFENEWDNRKDAVKHRILHALDKQQRIGARQTQVEKISAKEAKEFLEKYHTAGHTNASVNIGLKHDNELVAVMTFGKSRFSKKLAPWEVIRCAFSKAVVGGISKLIKAFQIEYQEDVMTYADRNWSEGKGYIAAGFEFVRNSEPGYFYFKDNGRICSRYAVQGEKIKEIVQTYLPELNEEDNMIRDGWKRVWNCGNVVLVKRCLHP